MRNRNYELEHLGIFTMKKMICYTGGVALVVLFVLTGLSGAENLVEKSPSAVLPEDRYEFGVIGEGIEISHDFTIRNKGEAILTIEPIEGG